MTTTNASSLAESITNYGGRNRIINGDCRFSQRGNVSITTAGNYGGPDRFLGAVGASAGGAFTQATGTITWGGIAKSCIVQQVTTVISSVTGANYWGGIQQAIEGYNCFDMLGQQVTLSFIFYTNVTGTFSVRIGDYTGANSYVTSFTATANTAAKYSFTLTLPTTLSVPNSTAGGLWITIGALNTGSYQAASTNTWVSGNYFTASGATNWASTVSNFIALTDIQFELGGTATPFERESFAVTVAKCQRYYQLGTLACGVQQSTTAGYLLGSLTVPMRVAPSMLVLGTVTMFNGSGNTNVTASTAATYTISYIASVTFSATGAAGYSMVTTNGTASSLAFVAEL
jgi:hypothetical protein